MSSRKSSTVESSGYSLHSNIFCTSLLSTASSSSRVKLWVIRSLTNILVIVSLVSSSYAIFLAVENAENTYTLKNRNFQEAVSGGWEGMWLFIRSFQVHGYKPSSLKGSVANLL